MLYIKKKGSVDYTIVGTPTIEDGVASDFSSSNYLGLNTTFDPKTPYKMQVKFKFNSVPDEYGTFFGVATTGIFNFGIRRQNSKLTLQIGNGRFDWDVVSLEGTTTLQANTDYWAQAEFTGTQYILRLSTDGVNWNEDAKITSSTVPSPGNPFALRIGYGHINWYFGGSIDLKQTYIKIDGQPWFGICPVEVKKHQIKGPVGYTVVGSPIIADGIVSGFTYNDYFVTAQQISTTGISSFEFYARVKTPSAFAEGWCRICNAGSFGNQGTTAGIFGGNGGASPYFHLFGIDIYQQLLTTDTWYRIKYLYSPSSYTATVYDDAGNVLKSYTYSNPKLNLQGVIDFCQRYSNYVLGAIDLNKTYIKVNGKMWFYQPANTKYIVKDGRLVWADPKLYLTGPVNYEVVGSPTITDSILSGCDNSNYLSLPSTLTIGENEDFDIRIKFKTNSLTSGGVVRLLRLLGGTHDYASGIFWRPDQSAIQFNAGALNGSENTQIRGMTTNTYYYVKATRTNGKNIVFGWSTDNVNWTTKSWENSAAGSTTPGYINNSIGRMGRADCTDVLIDLKETYIKVNGNLWFYGKNYASQNIAPVPANYTYGTTTTSYIGYVDMRTQQFVAAPTGATIGRDE